MASLPYEPPTAHTLPAWMTPQNQLRARHGEPPSRPLVLTSKDRAGRQVGVGGWLRRVPDSQTARVALGFEVVAS